ncbi:glycosyltransferase family 39 protein [Aeromicrobium sp.]|uniref:ArnT family glycosyltransferase n=1 Tax=Aeromicrobium sp. TaxID=1871063 RepID=UPI0019A895DB|nr:glycosyltransferase family 39 protein [Aeromicrobium sp.]MBC7631581.1 glycosyltransferase family 39 protein [Aeromicrobium sp.]
MLTPPQGSMVRWWFLCSAITVVLRTPFINVPLGIDEGGDAFVARAWGTTQGSMYGGSWLDRPPLLVLLYKIGVLGGDRGIRVLGMVAAIMLVAATMAIAHRISGARAARITGAITAVMTSSVVLGAVFTGNELLASVPVTFSIVTLVRARDSSQPGRWLFVSGFLATCALLIKQSFGEVVVAGAIFLLVSWMTRERSGFRAMWIVMWLAGVLTPLLVTLAWFAHYSVGVKAFVYAVVGFRLDSLNLLHRSEQGATYMLVHLGLPIAIVSGCVLLLPWAASWLFEHRTDPQLVLPLGAWLVVGFIGITGGGNYFPHYFIQPVAALAVLSGCALAVTGRRILAVATSAVLVLLALGNVAVGATLKSVDPPQQRTLAVSAYLRDNSRPDDSLYALYARANLLYYADMHSNYPYAWSTMVRALPDAERQLRTMLRSSSRRPTWIVEWQEPTAFGLDRSGETRRLIASHYVQVDNICGKPIMIRKDESGRPLKAPPPATCATLDLPRHLGPDASRNPSDGAEYLWQ